MNKTDLSEADICDRSIAPALEAVGWKKGQVCREFYFTDGQMLVRGSLTGRGKRKFADYVCHCEAC